MGTLFNQHFPATGKAPSSSGIGLHVCCAPCLARARATLAAAETPAFPGLARIFFYNPNIHPLIEFRRRVKALCIYLERDCLSAEIEDGYGLDEYLGYMFADGGLPANRRDRCYKCYRQRLDKVAGLAAAAGLAGFSTTLLASREQDHGLIETAGREAAAMSGVEFFAHDLSRSEPDVKRLRGIYRQQYCGCVFSEAERYRATGKHLYRSGGADDGEGD